MVSSCSAVDCRNRKSPGSSLSFHRFPSDKQRRKKWIENVCEENFYPKKHSRLCSAHFDPSCFKVVGGLKQLRYESVPRRIHYVQKKSYKNISKSQLLEPIEPLQVPFQLASTLFNNGTKRRRNSTENGQPNSSEQIFIKDLSDNQHSNILTSDEDDSSDEEDLHSSASKPNLPNDSQNLGSYCDTTYKSTFEEISKFKKLFFSEDPEMKEHDHFALGIAEELRGFHNPLYVSIAKMKIREVIHNLNMVALSSLCCNGSKQTQNTHPSFEFSKYNSKFIEPLSSQPTKSKKWDAKTSPKKNKIHNQKEPASKINTPSINVPVSPMATMSQDTPEISSLDINTQDKITDDYYMEKLAVNNFISRDKYQTSIFHHKDPPPVPLVNFTNNQPTPSNIFATKVPPIRTNISKPPFLDPSVRPQPFVRLNQIPVLPSNIIKPTSTPIVTATPKTSKTVNCSKAPVVVGQTTLEDPLTFDSGTVVPAKELSPSLYLDPNKDLIGST